MSFSRNLSDDEMDVYSRQLVLNTIGYEGQVKLKRGRVLLTGAGGLGTPISFQLVAMGVGYLRIIDRDIISVSDLHRQYLYETEWEGFSKVEMATVRLSALNPRNPRVKNDPIPLSIKQWNVAALLNDIDIVVDGLDSIETRYIVNRECVQRGIPYVYGGAIRTLGNVSTIIPKKNGVCRMF